MAKTIIVKSLEEAVCDLEKKMVTAGIITVNKVAAIGRKNAERIITEKFTLRSQFTVKALHFDQCKKSVKNIGDIKSTLGIYDRADYMALQESGGTKKSPTGANLIIPNTNARGGSNAKKMQRRYNGA